MKEIRKEQIYKAVNLLPKKEQDARWFVHMRWIKEKRRELKWKSFLK